MKSILKALFAALTLVSLSVAQDKLPIDSNPFHYHASPKYRNSEGHPLRLIAYVLHPVGWVIREAVIRPFSYFASADNWRKEILGYREPYDFRNSECFGNDDAPNCRTVAPYNYSENSDSSDSDSEIESATSANSGE